MGRLPAPSWGVGKGGAQGRADGAGGRRLWRARTSGPPGRGRPRALQFQPSGRATPRADARGAAAGARSSARRGAAARGRKGSNGSKGSRRAANDLEPGRREARAPPKGGPGPGGGGCSRDTGDGSSLARPRRPAPAARGGRAEGRGARRPRPHWGGSHIRKLFISPRTVLPRVRRRPWPNQKGAVCACTRARTSRGGAQRAHALRRGARARARAPLPTPPRAARPVVERAHTRGRAAGASRPRRAGGGRKKGAGAGATGGGQHAGGALQRRARGSRPKPLRPPGARACGWPRAASRHPSSPSSKEGRRRALPRKTRDEA
ncbi:MAG: hypothetical protein J3K34DRAFT_422865 [Monoraphidium minutum]|nr:MAG: hypothetical protein J3K34DRAFT_422865 [Monoraphidium minutum]